MGSKTLIDELSVTRTAVGTVPRPSRDRILDCAELLFAEHGFSAVSHRMVASGARVSLALVRYQFGSKQGLFDEVVRRRFASFEAERQSRLKEIRASKRRLTARHIVEAFFGPLLELASVQPSERHWLRLFAWSRVERGSHWAVGRELQRDSVLLFAAALAKAVPGLTRSSAARRLYLASAMAIKALTDGPRLEDLLDGGTVYAHIRPDELDEMRAMVVAAVVAVPHSGKAISRVAAKTKRE